MQRQVLHHQFIIIIIAISGWRVCARFQGGVITSSSTCWLMAMPCTPCLPLHYIHKMPQSLSTSRAIYPGLSAGTLVLELRCSTARLGPCTDSGLRTDQSHMFPILKPFWQDLLQHDTAQGPRLAAASKSYVLPGASKQQLEAHPAHPTHTLPEVARCPSPARNPSFRSSIMMRPVSLFTTGKTLVPTSRHAAPSAGHVHMGATSGS
jgi:hypothetical protein